MSKFTDLWKGDRIQKSISSDTLSSYIKRLNISAGIPSTVVDATRSKSVDTSFAGGVPVSLLAEQDLEGTTKTIMVKKDGSDHELTIDIHNGSEETVKAVFEGTELSAITEFENYQGYPIFATPEMEDTDGKRIGCFVVIGQDASLQVFFSLKDARDFIDSVLVMNKKINKVEECPYCDGTGRTSDGKVCFNCGGSGIEKGTAEDRSIRAMENGIRYMQRLGFDNEKIVREAVREYGISAAVVRDALKSTVEETGKDLVEAAQTAKEGGEEEQTDVVENIKSAQIRRQKATIAERAKEEGVGKSFKQKWGQISKMDSSAAMYWVKVIGANGLIVFDRYGLMYDDMKQVLENVQTSYKGYIIECGNDLGFRQVYAPE